MRDNRKSEKKLDELMKTALAFEVEPEEELNRQIVKQWKERSDMKKQIARRIYATAVACGALLITVSVGAAVKYLRPAEAAEKAGMESETIAAAFEGEDAIELNESKDAGDYRVTLLGITTSENLEKSRISEEISASGELYAVTAIECLDGTPMPEISDDAYADLSFFVSPLIQGLEPWQYNIASMGGGYSDFVENGILYRVTVCDDVSVFADRKLYLCVSDTTFYETGAYHYDETAGTITRNEEYDGINLLFDLPIDPACGDEAAAEEYLKALKESWESEDTPEAAAEREAANQAAADVAALIEDISGKILNGEEELALEGATLLEDATKTVTEKNGRYEYELTIDGQGAIHYFYKENFQNGKDVSVCYGNYDEDAEEFTGLYILILTENGDGTAEVRTYYRDVNV